MEKVPNRFFKKSDLENREYKKIYNMFEKIYVVDMQAGPHKLYSEDTNKIYWSRQVEYPWIFMNADLFGSCENVIDLGCGGSPLPHFIAMDENILVHAVDKKLIKNERNSLWGYNVNYINELREKYPKIIWGIEDFTNKLSVRDNMMDRIFSISVFEHLTKEELKGAFKEIYRILKPGALTLITVDVDGDHRDNEYGYQEIINTAKDQGLRIWGSQDWTIPTKEEMFGPYNIVGMVFTK
jgi:SAM-dependent methyltransferase